MKTPKLTGWLLAGIAASRFLGLAAGEPAPTYENNVRPILEKSCFKCHGDKKQKAQLRLDTYEALMKGSGNGLIVDLANTGNSMMLKLISLEPGDEDIMPPKGRPLSSKNIQIIRAWVEGGAKP